MVNIIGCFINVDIPYVIPVLLYRWLWLVHAWKLKHGLVYIKNTIDGKRVIRASSLSELFTWIDTAYAVHPNMRGHTECAMYMGYGVIHWKGSKQKLNVKSFTVSEYVPYNIWVMMFTKEQGYGIRDNIIYQDNQSTIKMLINGRNTCTDNSRHVNIRFFLWKIV